MSWSCSYCYTQPKRPGVTRVQSRSQPELVSRMNTTHDFEKLLAFIERLPAIDLPAGRKSIGHGSFENGNWWLKFSLDTTHPLAWRHVLELGHVLNYVSVEERLPTVFMPVSPPPYMN